MWSFDDVEETTHETDPQKTPTVDIPQLDTENQVKKKSILEKLIPRKKR